MSLENSTVCVQGLDFAKSTRTGILESGCGLNEPELGLEILIDSERRTDQVAGRIGRFREGLFRFGRRRFEATHQGAELKCEHPI